MSQAEILTSGVEQGRLALKARCSGGLAHLSSSTQPDEVVSSDGCRERGRLVAPLSPQAAAVLPVMLALARLQARRALAEQVR